LQTAFCEAKISGLVLSRPKNAFYQNPLDLEKLLKTGSNCPYKGQEKAREGIFLVS